MTKTAFITGITGQDGSYLAELLLSKGYEVHGLIKRTSIHNTQNIDHIKSSLELHYGDLCTEHHLCSLINELKPDEIYNLAAQSDVRISFDTPEYTGDVTGLGVTRILEAIRKFSPKSKFYQASSSEMFGLQPAPQNEETPFHPRSPYAIAKVYAYWMTRTYREAYGLFACSGILFNHESPRRGGNFVTRKITKAIARIAAGKQDKIYLGNLDAKRDWGYAPNYVEAIWLIVQHSRPDDFVIGTGEAHTVKDFLDTAFVYAGLDWHKCVEIDPQLYRPLEVNCLVADPSKVKQKLGWTPKTSFKELVRIMVDADLKGR